MAFSGTHFDDPNQIDLLKENIFGGIGLGPQSAMVIAIAEAINKSSLKGDVLYAGHSLGGRLASVAAMVSGNPVITANAAGVSEATMTYIAETRGISMANLLAEVNGGLVRAYRTSDDILTQLQENPNPTTDFMPDAVGTKFTLGGTHGVTDPVGGHDHVNVWEEYQKRYGSSLPDGFVSAQQLGQVPDQSGELPPPDPSGPVVSLYDYKKPEYCLAAPTDEGVYQRLQEMLLPQPPPTGT
ncbi:hypothetical protein [Aestuariimicrobium sp. Y1814]|uniref:hypothetical protein n=1 Tax=Aestuariimicrobium sp. Y1814 TaxID=3418742 RepID=UPI003DA735C6